MCSEGTAHAQQTAPAPPISHPQPPASMHPGELHPTDLRFVVVLDAAHGGENTGTQLGSSLAEKSYTLSLAVRIRTLLNARGIRSVLTRDSDVTVDNTTRAITANHARAAACLLLHATSTGNGIHLFTSSLAPAPRSASADLHRSFLPWQTAQASYVTDSLRLESDINAALAGQHLPVLLNRTPLAPLDNLACPAVAIEIAPLDGNTPVADSVYEGKIVQALAAALIAWHTDWRQQP